jgi:hypothetical protein
MGKSTLQRNKSKKPVHYVNNQQLFEEMKAYKDKVKLWKESTDNIEDKQYALQSKPVVPLYVAQSLLAIAERLSYTPSFAGYPFREDMIGDGVANCIEYIDNFNADKYKNPFSYFTQIIYFAFIRKIKKEQKATSIKIKAFDQLILELELEGMSSELQSVKPTLATKKNKIEV